MARLVFSRWAALVAAEIRGIVTLYPKPSVNDELIKCVTKKFARRIVKKNGCRRGICAFSCRWLRCRHLRARRIEPRTRGAPRRVKYAQPPVGTPPARYGEHWYGELRCDEICGSDSSYLHCVGVRVPPPPG